MFVAGAAGDLAMFGRDRVRADDRSPFIIGG